MNPPTEQLVRDYLNRLSVAARGKLTGPERQALLDRTRARIEAECGGVSRSATLRVQRALAGMGDPMAVVEAERVRIAADGEPQAVPVMTVVAASNGTDGAGSSPGMSGAVAGADPGLPRRRPGSGPRPGRTTLTAGRTAPPAGRTTPPAGLTTPPAEPHVPRQASSPESADPPGPQTPDPAAAGPDAPEPAQPEPAQPEPAQPEPAQPEPAQPEPSAGVEPDVVEAEIVPDSLPVRALIGARQRVAAAGTRVAALARQNPLEAVAVLLVGVGGAVFPPVWPLGALAALTGKAWDGRDKWTGLAVPLGFVILGAVLAPAFGGQHGTLASYAYAAWLAAGRLSRVAAPVGACYLAWRLHRGRRRPKAPPWNVPHRFG